MNKNICICTHIKILQSYVSIQKTNKIRLRKTLVDCGRSNSQGKCCSHKMCNVLNRKGGGGDRGGRVWMSLTGIRSFHFEFLGLGENFWQKCFENICLLHYRWNSNLHTFQKILRKQKKITKYKFPRINISTNFFWQICF